MMQCRLKVTLMVLAALLIGSHCTLRSAGASQQNQQDSPAPGGPNQAQGSELPLASFQIGFANHIRLGHWTHLSLQLRDPTRCTSVRHVEITCPDGDATPVTYRQPATCDDQGIVQAYFRLGRPQGEVSVRLLDGTDSVVFQYQFSVSEAGEIVKTVRPTARLIVGIGNVPEFRRSTNAEETAELDLATFLLKDSPIIHLPRDQQGYRGIDTVVLAATTRELLDALSNEQIQALTNWVERGGKLLMWVNPDLIDELRGNGRLSSLGRFDSLKPQTQRRLSVVERFADATVPIAMENPIAVLNLGESISQVVLSQDGWAVAGRYRLGMGTATIVALSLSDPPLSSWKYTPVMLHKFLFADDAAVDSGSLPGSARMIDNGYRDLAGQFRVPLEAFSNVSLIPFTLVAVLIGLFLLIVGPAEYFLLRSLREKMHWTWVSFPILVAAFCGLAYWLNHSFKSPTSQVNVCEVIDVEPSTSLVTGRMWAGIYSPTADELTIKTRIRNLQWGEPTRCEVTWMGHPGSGLGGMQTKVTAFATPEGYLQPIANQGEQQNCWLENYPINFASTRTVAAYFESRTTIRSNSRLIRTRRLDRLDGQVGNPFDFTLYNARLFYGESIFVPEKHLEPGDAVDVFTEMKERTIKNYFAGRTGDATKEGSKAQRWNPNERDVNRILSLAMIHNMLGGQRYSGLSNRYLEGLELSDQLLPDRAILVADITDPVWQLEIDGKGQSAAAPPRTTIIRIFLPVEIERARSESRTE